MTSTSMSDADWCTLLTTARRLLGLGQSMSWGSDSWCAWTTFSSLENWLTYWTCGLPEELEILDTGVADGSVWGQPFKYSDLAHLIIPATFYWERFDSVRGFENGYKHQNIVLLSKELRSLDVQHRLTDLVLEVKLY
jgi:hypothetical protein